jgi:hypothetical protein
MNLGTAATVRLFLLVSVTNSTKRPLLAVRTSEKADGVKKCRNDLVFASKWHSMGKAKHVVAALAPYKKSHPHAEL